MKDLRTKVCLLTDFFVFDEAYSLIGVAFEQIEMLRKNVEFVVVVDEAFPQSGTPWHADDIELRRIRGVPRSNTIRVDKTWEQDIEVLHIDIEKAISDCNVVITHDLIFQPSLIKHFLAAYKVAQANPSIRWLHWIHSATNSFMSQRKRFAREPFPNSTIVFPNAYDAPRVARNYEVPETSVAHVPHSTNPLTFVMTHPLSRKLAEDISLLDADVIGCYPARLDSGKQVEIGIEIFGGLKRMGLEVRYVVFDFHSTGREKIAVRTRCEQIAQQQDLEVGKEVIFTSTWSKETNVRCPRQMVRDFMAIGDVLILPSRSETYSLVAQEAAMCKNLLVLNFDFPPMRSIYGDDALYAKFSSNVDMMNGENGETTTTYKNRQDYMDEQARRVVARLNESMVLSQFRRVRKTRNTRAVWRDYLAPLIWGQFNTTTTKHFGRRVPFDVNYLERNRAIAERRLEVQPSTTTLSYGALTSRDAQLEYKRRHGFTYHKDESDVILKFSDGAWEKAEPLTAIETGECNPTLLTTTWMSTEDQMEYNRLHGRTYYKDEGKDVIKQVLPDGALKKAEL